jgi:hypothetical protein
MSPMNRPFSIIVLLFFCMCGLQQISAQASPTATAPGAYISVGGTSSLFQSGYGQRMLRGTGIFVDINPRRQVGIEAEGRWLQHDHLASTTQSTYLIGLRSQIRRGAFSPYVKTLVGLGYFNFPYSSAKGKYFVVAPGAGIDLSVSESLKIRLIDVEYQDWPQFTFGTINPYGVSFGFSYRIFSGSHTRLTGPYASGIR